jgi:hypothetical protein
MCLDILSVRLYEVESQEIWDILSSDVKRSELNAYLHIIDIEKSLGSTHSSDEKILMLYYSRFGPTKADIYRLSLKPNILISDITEIFLPKCDSNKYGFVVYLLPINILNIYDLEVLYYDQFFIENYYLENHNIPISDKKVKNAILINCWTKKIIKIKQDQRISNDQRRRQKSGGTRSRHR